MNAREQAKNGFKTFLVTFVVSVLLFGAFYYVITGTSPDVSLKTGVPDTLAYLPNLPEPDQPNDSGKDGLAPAETTDVLSANTIVPTAQNAQTNPFQELKNQKPNAQPKVVLSGSNQTSQTTVPDTGIFGITSGLLISSVLIGLFAYIMLINPRKYALQKFEEEAANDTN